MHRFHRLNLATLVQVVALLATLMGVVTWGVLLSATVPKQAQASSEPLPPAAASGRSAAQWFASSASSVQVTLSGLLASPQGAVAILSIDDAPPRAFLANEQLAEGVHLRRIEGDAVVIERGGSQSRLAIARLPMSEELPSLR